MINPFMQEKWLRFEFRGLPAVIPCGVSGQSLNKPWRVLFIFLQFLQKVNFLRNFRKINNPTFVGFIQTLRREGDSNPRYPFEVHTLSRRAS